MKKDSGSGLIIVDKGFKEMKCKLRRSEGERSILCTEKKVQERYLKLQEYYNS